MAERNGFLSGYNGNGAQRPGFFRGVVGRVGDRLVSGNNYNRNTGQWSATPGQYLTGLGSAALRLVNPALGAAASAVANGYYGSGPLAGPMSHLRDAQPSSADPVTRQAIDQPQYGLHVQNLGMGGQQVGLPNTGGLPLPPVQADSSGNGLGTRTGNAFAGGQMGGWLNGGMGNRQPGQTNFGGGRMGFSNGAGAGTGYGAFNVQNDSWGEAARGFGVGGMAGGARDAPMPGTKFHRK